VSPNSADNRGGGRVGGGKKLPGPEYVACVVTFNLGGGG
jgi:hypothetical protein